jgi:hypothetical protein
MIFHPRPGQPVRLHYRKSAAFAIPHHGKAGVVRIVSRGPGPRNVGVETEARLVVAPRGNLVLMTESTA